MGTKQLVRIAVLGAIGFLLMLLEFSILPWAPFLQYDPGEVPALLGGFAMGPWQGLAIVTVRSVLFFISGKDEAGWIGTLASFVVGALFVLGSAPIYRRRRSKRGAVTALLVGSIVTVAGMAAANYYFFLPLWMAGAPRAAMGEMIVKAVIPFNLIKVLLTSALTFLLYKRVSPLLH
ncbi:MAG: ECF transporter S component [Bacillota bacterium]